MNWVIVLLIVCAAVGLSAWLIFGGEEPQTIVEEDRGEEPVDWERPEELLTAEGEPVDPNGMGNLIAAKIELPVKDGWITGTDALAYFRSGTRVVFDPPELEERLKSARFDVSGELELFVEGRAVGADLHRLLVDAGFLLDDRRGVMVITEGETFDR